MIHVWPRYKELHEMKGGDSRAELEAAAATFSEQDWRDLQAWFNLAWFDPDFQEGDVELPDGTAVTVRHLIEKERGYTEADKAEIIGAQMAVARNVVAIHRKLQDAGRLEVTTTPYYHPILPLIYDTDLARVAMPSVALPETRFKRPDDAARHVEKAVEYYTDLMRSLGEPHPVLELVRNWLLDHRPPSRTERLDEPELYRGFFDRLSKSVFLEAQKI